MRLFCLWRRVCLLFVLVVGLLAFCYDFFPQLLQQPLFPISIQSSIHWAAAARQEFRFSPSQRSSSSIQQRNSSSKPKIAICLVGGARSFELTGPTISKYVLREISSSSSRTDVFLHAPLDKDSFKLFLLNTSSSARPLNFAVATIFSPKQLPEQEHHRELLTASGSPHGIQGLLQYFNLVEGCWKTITAYELKHGLKYDWVLRTRLDGYWNAPFPGMETLDSSAYTVPYGSQFGGLNDRLGAGNRETSKVALTRLSSLSHLHNSGYKRLNSEAAFKAQLRSTNTTFRLKHFPFCIVSSRKYGSWPPREWGVPVMALSSKGPLNGAKCRPCTPKLVGQQARAVAESLNKGWGWSGASDGIELCDSRRGWERNWESVFDRMVDDEARSGRSKVAKLTVEECLEVVKSFRSSWELWDSPEPETICKERFGA